MIEQSLEILTAAINRNNALLEQILAGKVDGPHSISAQKPDPAAAKKGKAQPAKKTEQVEEPAPEKETSAPAVTKEGAVKACMALAAAKDKNTAFKVLQDFNARNVNDLKADQYADFVAACDAALVG